MILLVEDNDNDQMLMLRALRTQNIDNDVVIVADGAETLDYLFGTGRFADRGELVLPTLILLDLKIPKVPGIDVLRRIRADQRLRLVPVVVLTSSSEEADVVAAYEGGCNSFIRKPIDFTQFVEAVRNIGTYWLFMNELAPRPQL